MLFLTCCAVLMLPKSKMLGAGSVHTRAAVHIRMTHRCMVSSAAPTVSACKSTFSVPFLAASSTPAMQPLLHEFAAGSPDDGHIMTRHGLFDHRRAPLTFPEQPHGVASVRVLSVPMRCRQAIAELRDPHSNCTAERAMADMAWQSRVTLREGRGGRTRQHG